MISVPAFDCQSCGACCIEAGEVVVVKADITPRHLTGSVRNVMGFASYEADDFRRMKRCDTGACVALQGTPGEHVRCSTYARRPAACRDYEPGNPSCLKARELIGLWTPATVGRAQAVLPEAYDF